MCCVSGTCSLLSTKLNSMISSVPEGRSVQDECVCTGPTMETITFTIDGKELPPEYAIVSSLVSLSSDITITNMTKEKEGLLCCHQPSSSRDCVKIRVENKVPDPKLLAALKSSTLREQENGRVSRTGIVVVQCTLVAFSETAISRGFMTLYFNGASDPQTFDLYPQLTMENDTSGNITWSMTYEFEKLVEEGDTVGCRWFDQEHPDILDSTFRVQFSSPESTTPKAPTVAAKSSITSPTTNAQGTKMCIA